VTTAARSAELPDVPTVADTVAGYEASAVTGIGAPRGTPSEIVERLNREINAAFADAAMAARLADTGGMPLPGSPAAFAKVLADETEKWGKVVRFVTATK
jgi:tripartite-type tricarboxylate transporter receptor subunit TctC